MSGAEHKRSRRSWHLLAFPALLVLLGVIVTWFDGFRSYREYVGRQTVPETLVRSGRTGKELRMLDYRPLAGVRVEGFDRTLPPARMPSTTLLRDEALRNMLPTVSVVADPEYLLSRDSGLIANFWKRGRGWERPAYISYFRDGDLAWGAGVGLRIHGGKSRAQDLKSFRVILRDLYGTSGLNRGVIFPGPEQPIHSLVIHSDVRIKRAGNVATEWHYTNPIAYEVARRIGCITPAFEPVRFYLNGVYQGPYVLTEHLTIESLRSRFGHEDFFLADTKSDDGSSMLKQGSVKELRSMMEWPRSAPAPLAMAAVAEKVDIDNLTNWLISVLYSATTDPFQGLVARDRSRTDGRWFWINWDMDHSFMDLYNQEEQPWEVDNFTGVSAIERDSDPRAVIFRRLRNESPEYRTYFLARLTRVLNHELTDEFMADLIDRYEATAARFGVEDRDFLDSIREFSRRRPAVLRRQMDTYFAAGPAFLLRVEDPHGLGLRLDGTAVGPQYTGWYFTSTPARIEVARNVDQEVRWIVNGLAVETSATHLELSLSRDTTVMAVPRDAVDVASGAH